MQGSARKLMFVRDPVLGSLKLSGIQEDLLKTVEVQRLSFVHQLGTTFQCYPGAHGMRLSHALGVSALASRICRAVVPGADAPGVCMETNLLEAAGMLHDIGHTPWSHTLEPVFMELEGRDHMDLVAELVTGERRLGIKGAGRIPSILEAHGLNPRDVADLIRSRYEGPRFLQQIIFGEVDADMLDYLQRDFYFTGVAFGHIEVERIISTMVLAGDRLAFLAKGLDAVRDFLIARLQMYSSVYLHKKTRIVDQMLMRAARRSIVELREIACFNELTDDELLSFLATRSGDPWVRDMAWRVKYRQDLFTQVFRIDATAPSGGRDRFVKFLMGMGSNPGEIASRLEGEIAARAGAGPGLVFVDLPLEAVKVSEERFEKVGIEFLDESGRTRTLAEMDPPFSEYLAAARPNRSLLTVSCSPEISERVSAVCAGMFKEAVTPLFP
ncbi:HD domain-containing protein, partial [Candidatus Fermentibacteria bacterium]|nr:HD domain-containing protein [Candidatus Fermentibacteria bacterium]